MKTKEELNALKEEVETVSRKLHELTDEELAQVTGGSSDTIRAITQEMRWVTVTELNKLIESIEKEFGITHGGSSVE